MLVTEYVLAFEEDFEHFLMNHQKIDCSNCPDSIFRQIGESANFAFNSNMFQIDGTPRRYDVDNMPVSRNVRTPVLENPHKLIFQMSPVCNSSTLPIHSVYFF